jgi:hypothetical protein
MFLLKLNLRFSGTDHRRHPYILIMHSISNRNFEIHNFALLTFRRKFQAVTAVLNCAVASTALRLSSASSSSSLFLSTAAAASRTSLSSRSRSMIRCSFSSACRSWLARPLALSASDYFKITRSLATLQERDKQTAIAHHKQLTMSALLMVMMLV